MKKSVLLTRSKSANNELKEKFISQDFDFLDCNLIKYKLFPVEAEYINKFSNLIILDLASNNLGVDSIRNIKLQRNFFMVLLKKIPGLKCPKIILKVIRVNGCENYGALVSLCPEHLRGFPTTYIFYNVNRTDASHFQNKST